MQISPLDSAAPMYRYNGNDEVRGTIYQIVEQNYSETIAWSISAQKFSWRGPTKDFEKLFERIK